MLFPGATHWRYGSSDLIVYITTKKGSRINFITKSQRRTIDGSIFSFNTTTGSLGLRRVTLQHEGTYVCIQYRRTELHPILRYTVNLTVQVQPVLIVPSKVKINTSDYHTFICSYNRAKPAPTSLEWRNGSDIVTSNQMLAVRNARKTKTYHGNVTSKVTAREHNHNQVLICTIVWNSRTTTASVIIYVQVKAVVSIQRQNPAKNPGERGALTLLCTLHNKGRPPPTIFWTKDSKAVQPNNVTTFSRDMMSMTVKNLRKTDNGDYRCHGRNSAGVTDSKPIAVDIDYQPRNVNIQEAPRVTRKEGSYVTLTCAWTAKPLGSIAWTILSTFIDTSQSKYHYIPMPHLFRSILQIGPLDISDRGVYTCVVDNGILSAVTSNKVAVDITYCPRAGRLSVSQGNTTPLVNKDKVTMKCSPNKKQPGNPVPYQYLWLRNGQLVKQDPHSDVLILKPNTTRDGGDIQCGLKNGVDCLDGNVRYSQAVQIRVQGPPIPDRRQTHYAISPGENITLSCGTQSTPVARYIWIRNGVLLFPIGKTRINGANLTITRMTDEYGLYKCIASNMHGSMEVQFNVTERGPPEHIIDLGQEQANLTSFSTTLYWTPGFDGGYPQTFSLEYKRKADKEYDMIKTGIQPILQERVKYYTEGLSEYTAYMFRVRAVNTRPDGPNRSLYKEIYVKTKNAPVVRFSTPVRRGTKTVISWKVVEGDVSRFRVEYRVARFENHYQTFCEVTDTSAQSAVVDVTLDEDKDYEFRTLVYEGLLPEPTVLPTVFRSNKTIIVDSKYRWNYATSIYVVLGTMLPLLLVMICWIVKKRGRWKQCRRPENSSAPEEVPLQSQTNENVLQTNPPPTNDINENVTKVTRVGSGNFGEVWKGTLKHRDGTISVVAVKVLKEGLSEQDRKDFQNELNIMKNIDPHPNVIELVNYCTSSANESTQIVLEFMDNGCLKSYLHKSRGKYAYDNLHGDSTFLTSRALMSFGHQIAQGMEHISERQLIHRDLAARNILLSRNLTCKICDFGMAADIQGRREYESTSNRPLPIRWMAPESIFDSLYTTKSDVWSFGVLLWEIITLAATPYPGLTALVLMDRLKQGYRMEKTNPCPETLYAMMLECWRDEPEDRPSFSVLVTTLSELYNDDRMMMNIADLPESIYSYVKCNHKEEKI